MPSHQAQVPDQEQGQPVFVSFEKIGPKFQSYKGLALHQAPPAYRGTISEVALMDSWFCSWRIAAGKLFENRLRDSDVPIKFGKDGHHLAKKQIIERARIRNYHTFGSERR